MPKTTPATFASRLRSLRQAARMTQVELSRLTGISQPRLCQLETGARPPTWKNIQALCDVFGVSADTLR
jgi:transcriptional regulator with XRE-family HTH domain